MNRWWLGRPGERFRVEITNRPDIGSDLKAPQTRIDGSHDWSYSLLPEVREGDLVFHHDSDQMAIVGCSRVAGPASAASITWRPKSRNIGPGSSSERAGWKVPLSDYQSIDPPVSLPGIRAKTEALQNVLESLRSEVRDPVYFPYTFFSARPLRPALGYLTKMPAAVVALFPELQAAATSVDATSTPLATAVGRPFTRANESIQTAEREPFSVDPDVIDRGTRGHARTLNALADWVTARGLEPLEAAPGGTPFDLAWTDGGVMRVAEVKSLTDRNEEHQLRFGLGQLLRYRQALSARVGSIAAYLVVEREPTEASAWRQLCDSLDITLVWPGSFPPA
jgi:hypothetical protein